MSVALNELKDYVGWESGGQARAESTVSTTPPQPPSRERAPRLTGGVRPNGAGAAACDALEPVGAHV